MKKVLVLIVCIQLFGWSLCSAEFEDFGAGARPLGMGSAFVGLADDAHSIYYNPGGLGSIGRRTFTAGYNRLYWGLSDGSGISSSYLGYVHPFGDAGSVGIGVLSFGVSQLYSETSILFSYGRSIRDMLPAFLTIEELSDVSVGLTLKMLSKGYNNTYINDGSLFDTSDSLFSGGFTKSGVSADIGVLYRYNYNFSGGLVFTDIVAPDMGMEGLSPLSRGLKIGGCYRVPYLRVVLDMILKNGGLGFRLGLEKWFMAGKYALRAGLSNNLSLGASYKVREGLKVEYAYSNPITGVKNTRGSHVISINMGFGEMTEKMKEIEAEEVRQIDAAKMLRQTMISEEEARIETSIQYYNEALKHAERGDFIEAQQKINSALTLNTENADIEALFKKLNTVAQVLPISTGNDNKSELIRKAVMFYINSEAKQVVNIFQYLVENNPKDKRIRDFMRIIKKQYPSIVRQEKISAGMNLVDQKLYRALNFLYEGKYDLAINECKAVIDVEPNNVAALTRMGSASYVLGQEVKALQMWTKALQLNPENEELADFLEEKGLNLEELKKKEEQRGKKEKAFKNSMNYYYKKEKGLDKEKRVQMLQKIINKYKETGVDIEEAKTEMKRVEKDKGKKKKVAEKEVTKKEVKPKASSLTPKRKTALKKKYWGAGTTYKKRGEFNKAIAEFEKLLGIDPEHQQSKNQIKSCREKMGQ